MITKEVFLKKYNISEQLFQSAEMSWQDLNDIYDDFSQIKYNKYETILEEFMNTYLKETDDKQIHSIRTRIKNPEHLIAKIIRKKQHNQIKYRNLNKENYEKFITDLIGIRCLVLFKSDWQAFHHYIESKFENNPEYYIRDCLSDFDHRQDHSYIAEKPKVHIRNGDSRELYDEVLPPDSVIDGKVYRSVHYIIKYKGIYLEIQVRTLFEEGWGEIDHAMVYPDYQDDKILKEYTELLNRLSGLADEMSEFFNKLKSLEIQSIESGNFEKELSTDDKALSVTTAANKPPDNKPASTEIKALRTLNDYKQSIMDEG